MKEHPYKGDVVATYDPSCDIVPATTRITLEKLTIPVLVIWPKCKNSIPELETHLGSPIFPSMN